MSPRRRRGRWPVAVAAGLAGLLAAAPSACSSAADGARGAQGPAVVGPASGSASPAAFRVGLETDRQVRADGLVEWRAAWVLAWEPVPGAAGYRARFTTSEGGGSEQELRSPSLRVDAAAGTSPVERVEQDQAAQLAFSGAQLSVGVAATGADGAAGAAAGPFAVGDVPADGVPVPQAPAGG